MLFRDRREAGQVLARTLEHFRNQPNVIVLALPRGGVPVAYEVARELNLPLDIFIVRKLGVPGQEELAMGAIASGGTIVMNRSVVDGLAISHDEIEAAAEREKLEIERRERGYRHGRAPLQIEGRTAILVDDGLATGASMRAAARALKPRAQRVIVAVPVASESTCEEFRNEVDEIICAMTPQPFYAVGMFTTISSRQPMKKSRGCFHMRVATAMRRKLLRRSCVIRTYGPARKPFCELQPDCAANIQSNPRTSSSMRRGIATIGLQPFSERRSN